MIYKIGQNFCFANWVQNKDSLSVFCIASEAFIRRNTVSGGALYGSVVKSLTCDLKAACPSLTGSTGLFIRMSSGKTIQSLGPRNDGAQGI